jgi:hypothetical protein
MNRAALVCVLLFALTSLLLAHGTTVAKTREFLAPHGERALLTPASKTTEPNGFAVAKAAWTPDRDYFVYSLENLAGHAPWHTATQFVSFKHFVPGYTSQVCLLDSYLDNPGITTLDFQLAPNSVTTRVYGASSDATVSLRVITPQTPINGRSRCVPCERATPVKFGP